MKITNVKIVKNKNPKNEHLKAYASLVIDECFKIRNIRIIERQDKSLFLAMPSKKIKDKNYVDVVFPIDRRTRREFEDAVILEYQNLFENNSQVENMEG